MRMLIGLMALLFAAPAQAQSFWNHNGSNVELRSSGASREFYYITPRAGLPVTSNTLLFKGTRNGGRYSGTAYVFSSICGAIGYSVSGAVNIVQRTITLYGKAPVVDSTCKPLRYREDELIFAYDGCGCECGTEPELSAIYPPPRNYTGTSSSAEAFSCPYLYAWNEQELRWHPYGKVIRDARGSHHEMSELIRLSAFATRFRISEEEPEHSFIDHVELRVELKDASQIILKPTTGILADRDKKRLYIPAFGTVEFEFKLPAWIEPSNVEHASLMITGYYESLSEPPICRPRRAASSK